MPTLLPIVASAYLLGSVPFSFLVARAFGVADVRRVGSGNVGATNVLRSAGRMAGGLALLLDAAKGALAVVLAARIAPTSTVAPAVAAVAAVVGHMHPVWLRFAGGKGVATGLGAFAPLAPLAAAGGIVAFALTLLGTRFVSVSSLVGASILAGLVFAVRGSTPVAWAAVFTAVLVFVKHRSNLRRLRRGTEERLGAKPGTTR
jgi:acyl phosphate:glycerol-3-phosphate acyltransferase